MYFEGKIVAEATYNIRTVASLTKEETVYQNYDKSLALPAKYLFTLYLLARAVSLFQHYFCRTANRKAVITGIGFGFSQCVIYFAYAGIFRYGAMLVENEEMDFENVFR